MLSVRTSSGGRLKRLKIVDQSLSTAATPSLTVPKRAGWQVGFRVRRCVNRTYRQVWTGKVRGRGAGVFRIPYTPRLGGLYIVIADYGKHPNVTSPKLRLRAR